MTDAQDNLAGLGCRAAEDAARLELVTSPGAPPLRGGYDTTRMPARHGTAASLASGPAAESAAGPQPAAQAAAAATLTAGPAGPLIPKAPPPTGRGGPATAAAGIEPARHLDPRPREHAGDPKPGPPAGHGRRSR